MLYCAKHVGSGGLTGEGDGVKRILRSGSLALSCLFLTAALLVLAHGIWDIVATLYRLEHDPGASGIDYLGIGWEAGSRLFIVSVPGLILSCVCRGLQQEKRSKSAASAVIVVFSCLVALSIFLFFL